MGHRTKMLVRAQLNGYGDSLVVPVDQVVRTIGQAGQEVDVIAEKVAVLP